MYFFATTSSAALAQNTGSAVLPHYTFQGNEASNTFIYLTNTTDAMLEVEISVKPDVGGVFYDDGNIIGGNIEIWNTLFASEPTSGPGPSAKLTMRGQGTSIIKLQPVGVNNGQNGTVTISWTSN